MMHKLKILILCMMGGVLLNAQNTYLIYFKQKNIAISKLQLSEEAIQRKKMYNIPLDEKDYSIEMPRLNRIKEIAPIGIASKWLNAVSVNATEDQIKNIAKLDFVQRVEILKKENLLKSTLSKLESQYSKEEYGKAYEQISIHNGQILHDNGFQGQGMKIAIFDAGFSDVKNISSFRHLFQSNHIFPVWNFVQSSNAIYTLDNHGTNVLGCMASYLKDTIIASAPFASYYLFITEDPRSESRLEEYNWALAAEVADSMGVDIINSSLGYAEFDDPSQNYTKAQMDGQTTIISKAAAIAANKGMLIVNSAGNQGNKDWKMITAPADVEDVITVGAVDVDRNIADFSSRGWNAKNIIKPNVLSVGKGTTLFYHDGNYHYGNGTSFSSPLIAGLIACFWQKNRTLTAAEIRRWVYSSSHLYLSPNEEAGFGIPDFKRITEVSPLVNLEKDIAIYPNPTQKSAIIEVNALQSVEHSELSVYFAHKEVMNNKISLKKGRNQLFLDIDNLSKGVYFVKIKLNNSFIEGKFEKL